MSEALRGARLQCLVGAVEIDHEHVGLGAPPPEDRNKWHQSAEGPFQAVVEQKVAVPVLQFAVGHYS